MRENATKREISGSYYIRGRGDGGFWRNIYIQDSKNDLLMDCIWGSKGNKESKISPSSFSFQDQHQ